MIANEELTRIKTMGFAIADMSWGTKSTRVTHTDHTRADAGNRPWTTARALCLFHVDVEETFTRGAWAFSAYGQNMEGNVAVSAFATLTLDIAALQQPERDRLERHFLDRRQLKLTVRFNGQCPTSLYVNLRP